MSARSATKRRNSRKDSRSARANSVLPAEIRIGIRLKHARLTKGLSLRQLADEVGCSGSFISKIENDKVRPSFSMLRRIVATLEMNVAVLFAEETPETDRLSIMRPNTRPVIRVDPVWQGERNTLERLNSRRRWNLASGQHSSH